MLNYIGNNSVSSNIAAAATNNSSSNNITPTFQHHYQSHPQGGHQASNTVNMKMSKLSNQTNSQDPQAVNSRIFVGNLNTFQCSKTDVERMFQIYGRLAGISMHKGYAFVQFTNPFDARNACLGEDGKLVLSQTLDVNMVAEPKVHQVGRKRQNVNKTGNDWDYFYDSYCSSTLNRSSSLRPKKRKRLMSNSSRIVSLSDAVNSGNINAAVAAATMAQHQQQLAQHQQQQQQQQHHQHHHQQQQHAAAAAMAAMANLLPQQQMLLHQQSILNSTNGAAAACNGTTTTPHHASLNMYLQQQQQHQQMKQQQHAAAAAVAAAQYAAVTNGGLQLKMSSPLMSAPNGQSVAASSASLLTHDSEQLLATTTAPTNHQTQLLQSQMQQQTTTHIMQPLTLTLSPQQQQQQQLQHHPQQQQHHHYQQQQKQQLLQNQQTMQQLQTQDQLVSNQQQWGPFKVYSNPDTLICGNCRECFNELAELLDHKKSYCKLRFTCKCQDITMPTKNLTNGAKLLCAMCKDAFTNPWDLMVHAQAAHMVNIYELGSEPNNNNNHDNNSGEETTEGVAIASTNTNNNEPNNNSLLYNNDNDSNNNLKNHNGGIATSRETISFKIQQHQDPQRSPLASTVANLNGVTTNVNGCSNGIVSSRELGQSGDVEAHLELKFGICNSPIGTINNKEENHRDDTSLDGRMSDDIKMLHTNGSMSSRGSSPALDNDELTQPAQQRACIVRTLSIEATTTGGTPTNSATLGLLTNSLALSLNNNAASQAAVAAAAASAPQ